VRYFNYYSGVGYLGGDKTANYFKNLIEKSLSTVQFKKYAEMLALSPFFCNFAFYEKGI